MSKVVRVRYENGVLKPLEPLRLEEGEEVVVVLKEDLVEYACRVRRSLAGWGRSLVRSSPGRGVG